MEDEHISMRTKTADTQGSELSSPLEADRSEDPTLCELRRLVFGEFKVPDDLGQELDFLRVLAQRDFRDHLIWRLRRCIVEKLGHEAASNELESTKRILSKDAKNYQAWSHREWIIRTYGGGTWWMAELRYCHEVLEKGIFNIFAWDQRCRAVRSIPNMEKGLRAKEVSYAIKAIQAQPGNEGPWTYLKCLYTKDQSSLYTDRDLESVYVDVLDKEARRVKALVEIEGIIDPSHSVVVDAIVDKRGCVHALLLIFDLIMLGYRGSEKLSQAIDVLLEYCGHSHSHPYSYSHSFSSVRPRFIPVKLDIFKKVCSLALSLDAERLCYHNNYCGYEDFQDFHLEYVQSLDKDVANMQLG